MDSDIESIVLMLLKMVGYSSINEVYKLLSIAEKVTQAIVLPANVVYMFIGLKRVGHYELGTCTNENTFTRINGAN